MPVRVYQIELTRSAERDLHALPGDIFRRIDRKIQFFRRIDRKIEALANDPRPNRVKKLQGSENSYRVRVGDYRILYEVEDAAVLVLIVRVAHRREVYD